MKRYYYHVSYFVSGKKRDALGDCVIYTYDPIKTTESINAMREKISEDVGGKVVILGFQLLRIEGIEPEEVAT